MAVYNRETKGPKIKNIMKGAEKRAYDSYNEQKHGLTNNQPDSLKNQQQNPWINQQQPQVQTASQSPGQNPLQNPIQNPWQNKQLEVNTDSNANINLSKETTANKWNPIDKFNRTKESFNSIGEALHGTSSFSPELQDDISKTIREISGAVRSGIIMPVRQVAMEVEQATIGRSSEMATVKGVAQLGASFVVDFAMQSSNQKIIKNIHTGKGITAENANERIGIQGLKDAHKILYNSGITKTETFKLRNEKDLRTLTQQIDAYSIKAGYGKLSTMKNSNLERMRDNLLSKSDSGSKQLAKLIDERLKINKTSASKEYSIKRNTRNVKRSFKRTILSPVRNSDVYTGYLKITQTKMATKAITRAVMFQGKMMYKGIRTTARGLSKGSQFVLRKTGNSHFIGIADGISHITNGVGGIADFGEHSISAVSRIPNNLKTKISANSIIAKDRIKNAPATIKKSKHYRNVSRKVRTTRVGKKVRSVKWQTKKVVKKVGRTKIGRVTKKVTRVTGRVLSAPTKLLGMATRGLSAALSAVKALLFKAILFLVGFVLIAAVICSAAAGVITTLTAIGDAVSASYEEFCANTAMGKAYKKLLEYEKTFYDQVSTIYAENDVSVNAEGYAIQGVYNYGKQYTLKDYEQETFTIVDGNGVELSGNDMYNTKAILALAATYIDQDFSKYSGIGGALGGIYQDYCLRLYKNSHSVFIETPSQSDVYYCADYDSEYGGSRAASDCTNKEHIKHGTWTSKSSNPPPCQYYTEKDVYSSITGNYRYTKYKCKGHDYCRGHIDARVQAVVSGAYLPEDYDKVNADITETDNNLYNVDAYGNAYMYEDASDSVLGSVASMAINIGNTLFSVPLSFVDINFGDEVVDNVAGITVYYKFKGEKTNEAGEEYKFRTHFGEPNRTFDGWNESNMTRARLLLAGDWEDLYGIDFDTDFESISFDSAISAGGGPISGEYLGGEVGTPIANYYNQGEYSAYKMLPGCGSTIKSAGCGFCSLAMVANTLTGDPKYTPVYVVNQLAKDFYTCGVGGNHDLPTRGAARFGLTGKQISLSSQSFADVIDSGGLVIALIGDPHPKTEFYGGKGHYIVIRGVTETGKIVVADPGRRANNGKAWPINQMRLRMAWSIYYNE